MVRGTEPRSARAEVEPTALMVPLFRLSRDPRRSRSARWLPLLVAIAAASLASSTALRARAPRGASAELFTGAAWNVPTRLVVRLDGARRVIRARYSTRPFEEAPYFSYRLVHGSVGREIDVEMLHHKPYLENPVPPRDAARGEPRLQPADRERGIATDWLALACRTRHRRRAPGGYRRRPACRSASHVPRRGLSHRRLATQLSFGRRYPLSGGAVVMTASPEVRLTAAVARVPLEGGMLTVPNVALHALGGVGVRRTW